MHFQRDKYGDVLLIYICIEGTITFAGEEMVKFAKEIIPEKYIL